MNTKLGMTHWVRIYIAGDYDKARDICRNHCYKVGLCVNVTKNAYIYTGGEEEGVIVELIAYPRFPETSDAIAAKAYELGVELKSQLCQDSFLIMDPNETLWVTNRENDDEPKQTVPRN